MARVGQGAGSCGMGLGLRILRAQSLSSSRGSSAGRVAPGRSPGGLGAPFPPCSRLRSGPVLLTCGSSAFSAVDCGSARPRFRPRSPRQPWRHGGAGDCLSAHLGLVLAKLGRARQHCRRYEKKETPHNPYGFLWELLICATIVGFFVVVAVFVDKFLLD